MAKFGLSARFAICANIDLETNSSCWFWRGEKILDSLLHHTYIIQYFAFPLIFHLAFIAHENKN